MMSFAIYYRADDGEIIGWTTGHDPQPPEGYALAQFAKPFDPDPTTQKIIAGELVDKTAAERAVAVPMFRLTPIQ